MLSSWWEQLEEEALQQEAQDVQARYAGQFALQRTALNVSTTHCAGCAGAGCPAG